MNVHPIVQQIVDRCHVGESYLSVIREVISRLKNGRKTFLIMPRKDRRELVGQVVLAHKANRQLYHDVTTGNL